jgi:UDP-glucuronate 4-epimerase
MLENIDEINQVIHLAARAGVIPSVKNPLLTFEHNVIGTQSILEFCRTRNIPKVTLASSSSVYGDRSSGPFRETDDVLKPASPYAASKVMNEAAAHSYYVAYGIDVTCMRLFTVYGPRQRPDMAIYHFVKQLLERKELQVYGSPESSRDYTFIDDIIQGIHGCMNLKGGYRVVNLGNSKPVQLGKLVDIIISATGIDTDVEWLPGRIGDVQMTWAAGDLALELMGFKPRVDIEEGVEKFVEWYKSIVSP